MPYTNFQTVTVSGAFRTEATGINNADEVSGYYIPFSGSPLAFTEVDGSFSFAPSGTFALGRDQTGGINNLGQVAATEGGGPTPSMGAVWSPNAPTTVISQNGVDFSAFDINDAGTVVGSTSQGSPNDRTGNATISGFTYQNGALTLLQVPGASATEAHGINNGGAIVGTADNYGFIDIGGQISLMSIPGATITDPMAINTSGAVAGSYYDGTHWHGFVDTAGQMQFINEPGAVDTLVTGINDNGDIVGFDGNGAGFIATDPPIPTAAAQIAVADPVALGVDQDYLAGLGREADPGGLAFWANFIKTSPTPQDFVYGLVGSAEFQSLHGQQSDAQYVDSLYINALGHQADPVGEAAWVNILHSGANRGDVLWAIAQSPEGQQHFNVMHA